ncbi:MAG TPA: class I SAM-dependent methyltransferase [Caldimonas sp.]|jgi:hypothetical protein|nr:class I SAM-dependent methyltransferase [Caldimonas sp.]HEX2541107.1 class I SAM-dependent methyltransferase [Caldimonas sp.]
MAWPLPALVAWAGCWAVFGVVLANGGSALAAWLLAGALGAMAAVAGSTPWRRVFIGSGFPLSAAALGAAASQPAWAWLVPLAMLALVYPLRAWSDAPLFPTPRRALHGLARAAPLPRDASVLDAGCGLGAGLMELRREYPDARAHGVEWSWPLRRACAWRCRFADVRRGDLWQDDWSRHDLVYLFQRPESMPRALAKAACELRDGAWLVSLEFPVSGLVAEHSLEVDGERRVWLYRAPLRPSVPDQIPDETP